MGLEISKFESKLFKNHFPFTIDYSSNVAKSIKNSVPTSLLTGSVLLVDLIGLS